MSGPIMDPSSAPRPSKLGSPLSAPRLPTSSRAVLGRTATSRASTRACAMSCSMARSSTPSTKLRSSSKAGGPLQYDQAACLTRLQATSTRGVHARLRRVAGCATSTGFAGHAGTTANLKLTFHPDHSMGADQGLRRRHDVIKQSDFAQIKIASQWEAKTVIFQSTCRLFQKLNLASDTQSFFRFGDRLRRQSRTTKKRSERHASTLETRGGQAGEAPLRHWD